MKTTKATIKIVNRAGYLFLSISWHGRVFKSTQYKCDKRHWNEKTEQCTSKCPNYRIINFEINKSIIDNNVKTGMNDELINLELTPYSARHTFATVMINSGASLNDIASLMGRSVEGLSDYIQTLTKAESIIDVRNKAEI